MISRLQVSGDGSFVLQPKASVSKGGTHQVQTFEGPELHFNIQLDPNKPERLDVTWDADGEQVSWNPSVVFHHCLQLPR